MLRGGKLWLEAAVARERAEFDRILAEKERKRKEVETEDKRKRQSQRAKFECDVAVFTANRKVAIFDAKLRAIEHVIREKVISTGLPTDEVPVDCKKQGLAKKPRN